MAADGRLRLATGKHFAQAGEQGADFPPGHFDIVEDLNQAFMLALFDHTLADVRQGGNRGQGLHGVVVGRTHKSRAGFSLFTDFHGFFRLLVKQRLQGIIRFLFLAVDAKVRLLQAVVLSVQCEGFNIALPRR